MSVTSTLRISASILALGFSTSAFAASPAEDLVAKWLTDSSFGLPVKIGSSTFEPGSQSVVLSDVVIGEGSDFQFKYGTFIVGDPREDGKGMFAAQFMRGENVEVKAHIDFAKWIPTKVLEKQKAENPDAKAPPTFDLNYKIESLLYLRPVMPMSSPVYGKDASVIDNVFTTARWFTTIRYDWLEANNVTASGSPIEGQEVFPVTTYEQIYASGFHEGRLERAGMTGMSQTQNLDGEELTTKIGRVYLYGQDLNAILDTIDPKAYKDGKGDGVWRTALLSEGYSDISVTTKEGVGVNIGNISVDGFRVRQTEKPILATLSEMMANPEMVDTDPMPFLEDLLPNILGYYGVDRFRLSDLKVNIDEKNSGGIGAIQADNVDSNGIGSFSISNVEVNVDGVGSGSLNDFSLYNVRFGDLLAWIRLGKASDEGQPTPAMIRDAILEGNVAVDFMEILGLNVETPAGTVKFDSVTATQGDYLKNFPRRYDVNLYGLNFPVSLLSDPPEAQQELEAMGYTEITADFGSTFSWDTEKGDVRAEDVTLNLQDMGKLSGDIHFGNLPLSIFDQPMDLEARAQEGTLVSAKLAFTNQSIVERTFEAQAKKLNQKPEDFRKNFASALPMMLGFLDDKDIQTRFQDVLVAFFTEPQSLVVTVKPAAPLSFATMAAMPDAKPQEIMDILKFNIEANK